MKNLIYYSKSILSLTMILLFADTREQIVVKEQLEVFANYRGDHRWMAYQNLGHAWYTHIYRMANEQMKARDETVNKIRTLEDWEERKIGLRDSLQKSIGRLPEKTPLNAQIVGTIERKSFRVEKVIYESSPKFYVTACLFIPNDLQEPAPGIVYCAGHTPEAFRAEMYQRVIINLVEKGFVVLTFDPLGQGERFFYLDDKGQPELDVTQGHSYAGIQCLLTGDCLAKYMIHDGIRAVDYLLSRPEVDPDRIGMTGRSGGGTQSAIIGPFDDRIYASAPENYVSSLKRIWQSMGPRDAEQNFPNAHLLQLEHADFIALRAPKPTMIIANSRDFYNIQGARETFQEVQRIFDLYGAKEQVQFAEDHELHRSTPQNREAMYAFFMEQLQLKGDPTDVDVPLFSKKELTITKTGQIRTSLDSKSLSDLNRERPFTIGNLPLKEPIVAKGIIRKALNLTDSIPVHQAIFSGGHKREGYLIEKHFLQFEDDRYPLPFLFIQSAENDIRPTILYLHSQGKSMAAQKGGPIEQLVRAGYNVIAPDLLNMGELATTFWGDSHIQLTSFNMVVGSSQAGTSLVSLQITDLIALKEYIASQEGLNDRLIVIADEELCTSALHFAALEPSVEKVIFSNPLESWMEIVATEKYPARLAYAVVPGVLQYYDLPDLRALIGPSKIIVRDDAPLLSHLKQ